MGLFTEKSKSHINPKSNWYKFMENWLFNNSKRNVPSIAKLPQEKGTLMIFYGPPYKEQVFETSPFPKIDLYSIENTKRLANQWVIENALKKAEKLNDVYSKKQIEKIRINSMKESELDRVLYYLTVGLIFPSFWRNY